MCDCNTYLTQHFPDYNAVDSSGLVIGYIPWWAYWHNSIKEVVVTEWHLPAPGYICDLCNYKLQKFNRQNPDIGAIVDKPFLALPGQETDIAFNTLLLEPDTVEIRRPLPPMHPGCPIPEEVLLKSVQENKQLASEDLSLGRFSNLDLD